MHQWHAELRGQTRADVARVGIVAMDQAWYGLFLAQEAEHVVGKGVEVVPELLLRQVTGGASVDSHDARAVADGLDGDRIVRTQVGVVDAAREQVDAIDIGARGQCPRQFHDIQGLAAGVGIAAEFQLMAPDQTVNADQDDVNGPVVVAAHHVPVAVDLPIRLQATAAALQFARLQGAGPEAGRLYSA